MKSLYSRTAASSVFTFALAVLFSLTPHLRAQISVGITGAGPDAFATIPGVTNWSTKNLPGAAGAPEGTLGVDADGQIDAFVNGTTNDVATINTAVGNNAGNPPATAATAQWSSAGLYLNTRPTGNAVTLLMATLRNDSGGVINSFRVEYEYQNRTAAAAEVVPGNRVYYSTSGAAGSWVALGNFGNITVLNTAEPISIPVNLVAGGGAAWAPGALLYILFADDNSNPNADAANGIDNFAITSVVGGVQTCVAITNQTSSITVPERGSASFSIMATGSPQSIQWYRGGAPILGANGATYTIPSVVYPGDNGAQFQAIVTNTICTNVSTVKTLTVLQDTNPPVVLRAVGDIDPTKVNITFSEPVDPATVTESSFTIFQTGTDWILSPYITFGVALTNGTNLTITTDARLTGISYSLLTLDLRDASSGNNLINPNPTTNSLITTVQLIGFDTDNEWKYFIGSDIFGTGWELPGYDDSTWLSGPAGLGLDSSANGVPIRTTIAYTATSEPVWFRKHFNFPGKTNGVVMTMRDVVEDGAVYYLNGQELFRHNVGAGALTYATRSAAGQTDPTPIQGPFIMAITNLQPGDNVLAVVVVQSGATSSDVELAVELTATIEEFLTGAPKITAQPANQTVTEGGTVNFAVSVEGAIPLFYTWKKGGVAIPNATNSSYSIVGVVPNDSGSYSVSVTNAFGGTNSTAATLTVGADTNAPFIVSVIGETNLNVVTLTLRDPQPGRGINLASANDPTHYQIVVRTNAGISLSIVSVVATNIGTNTIVTITTATGSPRVIGQDYNVILTGVVDNSVAANAVTPNTGQISARMVFFPYTQTWRYDQSGTDLGTTWKDVGYNDGAWLSGQAILGFETTSNTLFYFTNTIGALPFGTNTVLSLTNGTGAGIGGTNVTFYFRTTVNIPFNPAGATFTARAYIDDGAIFYVNGIEQLRYNMTNGPGYTNFANGGLTEPNPNAQTTVIASNIGGFVQGANVIAVEVHQDLITSSDVDFGMQLEGLVNSFNVITGPRLNVSRNLTTGQVTISWTGSGTLQQANTLAVSGASTWSDVPGNPNPYTFTPVAGQNRFFSLRQ